MHWAWHCAWDFDRLCLAGFFLDGVTTEGEWAGDLILRIRKGDPDNSVP